MKKLKRVIASLLCMLMLLQPVAFAASVADFLDFPNGWSKDAMTAAVENGLYIGNESKLIQPDKALTRAELADADEIMISSTTTLVRRACELDGAPVGGRDTALFDRIQQLYVEKLDRDCI